MRESILTRDGVVVSRTVTKPVASCLKAQADTDAVVPFLHRHNMAVCDVWEFSDGAERWVIACSCGDFIESDRLLSRLTRAYDAHAGVVAAAPVSVGMMTVEV